VRQKIKDSLNMISKLTFRRFWNIIKNFVSFYLSRIIHKTVHCGMPMSIAVEPTTSCNLRCVECPAGQHKFTRQTGMLANDDFKKIIDELYKNLMYLILYFQGEPYLNSNLFEFIKYAKKKNIYTMTSTNAHFLDDDNSKKTIESGLDRLIISMDGTDQETYSLYRAGGDIQKVKQGIKNIVKWKKKLKSSTPYVILQFLVLKTNEHQIEKIKKVDLELGVDKVQLKTAQIYDFEQNNSLIPLIDRYSRYKKQDDGTYVIKNKLYNHCFKMWSSGVITWDGLVVPCCFDKDAKHILGDLKQDAFKNIWKNDKYKKFRTSVFENRKDIDICCNCSEK